MLLGLFYSAKLKAHQRKWLPCEVEALAISAAVNHWVAYILESVHTVQILTDSRPCVQAFKGLCQGQFSHSARVSTFLSTLRRYNVCVQYIPGELNLPADYQSRNPPGCDNHSCPLCRFLSETSIALLPNLVFYHKSHNLGDFLHTFSPQYAQNLDKSKNITNVVAQ